MNRIIKMNLQSELKKESLEKYRSLQTIKRLLVLLHP